MLLRRASRAGTALLFQPWVLRHACTLSSDRAAAVTRGALGVELLIL
jgi:hypothetical protein